MTERVPGSARLERWIDRGIFTALTLGYVAWLASSVRDLGYARDEGFYFHAAQTYGQWFELLWADPARAVQRASVDRFWQENHEHPALMKSLFWASRELLEGRVFSERGTAYRFPGMLLSGLVVATVFAWGRRVYGRLGGVFAALVLALMPRVFFHSHLACFDMPIVALCTFTAYAYHRSLEPGRWGWAIGCGVLYGLALNTKHNAWLLPFAFVGHAVLRYVLAWRAPARPRLRIPLALVCMALLGPLLLYAGWPWIWNDTYARLVEYVKFHTQHVYYNMEFLGRTYFEPPFPRGYAWVMTLGTVPFVSLLASAIGVVAIVAADLREHGGLGRLRGARRRPLAERAEPLPTNPAVLWALCLLAGYAPWWSTDTPIFGGTKHWMTAYPFMALFAGRGAVWLGAVTFAALARLRVEPLSPLARRLVAASLAVVLLAPPAVITWHSHPWGLSAYTPLVGGASGAATLGLNRTYWGYTTGAVQGFINEAAPKEGRVFIHDTAMDSFRMLQKDRRIRRDIKPWWTVSGSQLALYHHEPHMSRVEHMIWTDYGTTSPSHIGAFDGVPVVWVYERSRRPP